MASDNQHQQTVLLLKDLDSTGNANKDPYSKLFKSKGLRTVFAPILSFEFCNEGTHDLARYLENQFSFSGVIFTSKNAVAAFESAVSLTSFDMKHVLTGTDVFVVGKATEKALSKWDTVRKLGSNCGNADELSDYIMEFCKEKQLVAESPFLFPCGEMALSTLPDKLLANGLPLERFIVYSTVKHADFETVVSDCLNAYVSAILFFSPSGVRFSFDAVTRMTNSNEKIKLIAFGETTKNEIERYFLQCHGVAAHPTPDDAYNAVLKALDNN